MIQQTASGHYVIASGGTWLPGAFADARTARFAFRLPAAVLWQLQDKANIEAAGDGGVLTWGDLARAAGELRKEKQR